MAKYLPDDHIRCSAYWYASRAGMMPYGITDPDDLEFLRDLGVRAVRLARWYGYPAWLVPEGPFWVHMWPEHVWDEVASAMASKAADHGYWETGDYP